MKNSNTLSWLSCLLFTGLCLSLVGCSSDNESTDYRVRSNLALVDSNGDDNISTEEVDEIDDNQIAMCPTCGGNGAVIYFDGSIIPCYNCNGRGLFTVAELQAGVNANAGCNNGGYEAGAQMDDSYDGSVDRLERELSLHESNLASLYECLEVVDGSINQTYLRQQISEEEYAIKAIKRRLENM